MKTVLNGWLGSRSSGRRAALVIVGATLLAALALAGPVSAVVISNPGSISIPSGPGPATPYPATINVSGQSGTITDLNVTLQGVSHAWPDDVSALLVGPGGQKVMLMSDVGGRYAISGVNLTFDDEAASALPNSARIATGSYRPTQGTTATGDGSNPRPANLPAPAPAAPYSTSLSQFDGADPNGTYSLYVYDDSSNDSGQIASGFNVDITTGSGTPPPPPPPPPGTDRLPDLAMDRMANLHIQNNPGSRWLRFGTTIVNIGAGDFEARGTRPDTSGAEMTTVSQRIFNDAGGYRDRATTARMYYAGDGHSHWHLRDLEDYVLTDLDDSTRAGTGAKHGFCFYDNVRFGSTQPVKYTGCANDQPNALTVTMGLSRGWGDLYPATIVDQYIDITGLPAGRYRLQATADADNWFLEGNESNNFTWVDIQIPEPPGTTVSVIQWGPAAQPISG